VIGFFYFFNLAFRNWTCLGIYIMKMEINYKQILEQIKPFEEEVFYMGLAEQEVQELQFEINTDIPPYYLGFLRNFGFLQDFVAGLFTNKKLFVDYNTFFKEVYNTDLGSENYLMIGDNGGEDFWIIRTDDPTDLRLYNWVDDEVEDTGMTFSDLLKHAISVRTDAYTIGESNDKKYWNVQFMINTKEEKLIYKTLGITKKSDWLLLEESETAVRSYVADAVLNGKVTTLHKSEGPARSTTSYYFDWQEAVSQTKRHSYIREWEKLLAQNFSDFTLMDYGIRSTSPF